MKAKIYFFPIFSLIILSGIFGMDNIVAAKLQTTVKELSFIENTFVLGLLYLAFLERFTK